MARGTHWCTNFFNLFCPTSVSVLWRICVQVHKSDCAEIVYQLPLLPNNTAGETFLHKSGAVWSVDWIFTIGTPGWRWLGEYVTLDRRFYCLLFKQEVAAGPSYCHIFLFIAFVGEAFIRNVIITLCISYINVIRICINNNWVVNNNLWKTPRP
jgi:hypothetical protein